MGAGGPGVGGRVALFRADGSTYNPGTFVFPGYGGPISVAAGDVSGDGVPDIVAGAGLGVAGGHVKALSGTDLGLVASFAPFDPSVISPIDVQVANANGDSRADIFSTTEGYGTASLSRYDGFTGQVQLLIAGNNAPPQGTAPAVLPYPVRVPVGVPYSYPLFFYDPFFYPAFYGFGAYGYAGPGYVDPGYGYYDPGFIDPGYGYYDPGYVDPGYFDPGFVDPGYFDPGYFDPGYFDPGDFFYF